MAAIASDVASNWRALLEYDGASWRVYYVYSSVNYRWCAKPKIVKWSDRCEEKLCKMSESYKNEIHNGRLAYWVKQSMGMPDVTVDKSNDEIAVDSILEILTDAEYADRRV